jgi:hypothetical protein
VSIAVIIMEFVRITFAIATMALQVNTVKKHNVKITAT